MRGHRQRSLGEIVAGVEDHLVEQQPLGGHVGPLGAGQYGQSVGLGAQAQFALEIGVFGLLQSACEPGDEGLVQSRRAVDALSLGQPEEICGVGLQEQVTAGATRPQPDDAVQSLSVLQRHQRFVQGDVEGRARHQAVTAEQQADGAGRGLLGAAERIVGERLRQRQRINPQPGDTQPQTGMD